MMKHTYKYILFSLFLLAPVMTFAQSKSADSGVVLNKSVSAQNPDGSYTIKLETYAEGDTEVEMNDVASDVVLILDLSSSMAGHRSSEPVTAQTSLSYNDVVNSSTKYLYWFAAHNYAYQIMGLKREIDGHTRYYLYWVNPNYGNLFMNASGQGATTKNGEVVGNWGYPLGSSTDVTTVTNANLTSNTDIAYAVDDPDAPIVTFAAGNTDLYKGTSRLSELQSAVCEFIDQIDDNDKNKTNADGSVSPRTSRLGNKISIIVFSGSSFGSKNYKIIQSLDAIGNVNIANLKSEVNDFTLATGTKPKDAVLEANTQLTNAGSGHTKTIVFFTDGQADDQPTVVANAKTCKDNNTKVYSIAMFGSALGETSEPYIMLQRVSSNYPSATGMGSGQAGTGSDDGGYFFDVSEEGNLSQVFTKIAGNITAGSENEAVASSGAHSRIQDVLTSSFTLPTGFSASNVVVYTVEPKPNENSTTLEWYDVPNHTVPNAPVDPNGHVVALTATMDENSDYLTDPSLVLIKKGTDSQGRDMIRVEGFDFAKDDSSVGAGDGNWVGRRYKNGKYTWAGKKLVIEFNINYIGSATGGDDTQTNTAESGLYIWSPPNTYSPLVMYDIPDADIPINIVIKKYGLKHGESATIQIYRAPQSTEYNTETGKLKPLLPDNPKDEFDGWENFTKVILTNAKADNTVVTETLLCLDPHFVYLLAEDDWGWSYNLVTEHIDTSEQIENPFIFTNTLKTDAVKHAEAAAFNYFSGPEFTPTTKTTKVKSKEKLSTPVSGNGN